MKTFWNTYPFHDRYKLSLPCSAVKLYSHISIKIINKWSIWLQLYDLFLKYIIIISINISKFNIISRKISLLLNCWLLIIQTTAFDCWILIKLNELKFHSHIQLKNVIITIVHFWRFYCYCFILLHSNTTKMTVTVVTQMKWKKKSHN